MASPMAPPVFDTTTLDFDVAVGPQPQIAGTASVPRHGSVVKFQDSWRCIARRTRKGSTNPRGRQPLPLHREGESVRAAASRPRSIYRAPPRFSQASLVKELDASASAGLRRMRRSSRARRSPLYGALTTLFPDRAWSRRSRRSWSSSSPMSSTWRSRRRWRKS